VITSPTWLVWSQQNCQRLVKTGILRPPGAAAPANPRRKPDAEMNESASEI